MLLSLSICGRKMSIFRYLYLKMPFYSKLMFPSKDCFADFRWLSVDFVDALCRHPVPAVHPIFPLSISRA